MSADPPPTVGSGSITSIPALADHPPPRQALAPRWRSIRLSAVRAARIRVRQACPPRLTSGFEAPSSAPTGLNRQYSLTPIEAYRAGFPRVPILAGRRAASFLVSPGDSSATPSEPVIECNSLAVGRVDLGEVLIVLHAFPAPIVTRGRALSDEIVYHAPVDIRQ